LDSKKFPLIRKGTSMREHGISSTLDEIGNSAVGAERPLHPSVSDYAKLKQLIKQKGLLERNASCREE